MKRKQRLVGPGRRVGARQSDPYPGWSGGVGPRRARRRGEEHGGPANPPRRGDDEADSPDGLGLEGTRAAPRNPGKPAYTLVFSPVALACGRGSLPSPRVADRSGPGTTASVSPLLTRPVDRGPRDYPGEARLGPPIRQDFEPCAQRLFRSRPRCRPACRWRLGTAGASSTWREEPGRGEGRASAWTTSVCPPSDTGGATIARSDCAGAGGATGSRGSDAVCSAPPA